VINKIRVLIVDDSGYVIAAISRRLQADYNIEVIGSARTGIEAVEKVKSLRPDVVTLDIVMPEMDGLTALKRIMSECPTPVIMLSALTRENAEPTIQALEYGAVDFFLKPSAIKPGGNGSGDDTLINKIKIAAKTRVNGKKPAISTLIPVKRKVTPGVSGAFNKLVLIGSSTGGPRALMQVIPNLPEDISAAILLVQHMPPGFTKSLAERLNMSSAIQVAEAKEGDELKKGVALMAPGDYHMILGDDEKIHLTQDPPLLGVRPSVDVMMKSAVAVYKKKILGVVLTGMGTDGTIGASVIKGAGGKILAQDEATSAVYGMPASVAQAGCVDKVLPLTEIAAEIAQECGSPE
jgi:two-component system, chemotaxis family, protein-glutamate methylesterase/glutaminase